MVVNWKAFLFVRGIADGSSKQSLKAFNFEAGEGIGTKKWVKQWVAGGEGEVAIAARYLNKKWG